MKKIVVAFVAVFMLSTSTLSANEMAKADAEYIFSTSKASSQVVTMDNGQMVTTEGEGWITASIYYAARSIEFTEIYIDPNTELLVSKAHFRQLSQSEIDTYNCLLNAWWLP